MQENEMKFDSSEFGCLRGARQSVLVAGGYVRYADDTAYFDLFI